MKAILPFSLNLLEYSESDFWIYVNIKEGAEILPGIARDCKEAHTVLCQAATEYCPDDLDNLLNGLAGNLFPSHLQSHLSAWVLDMGNVQFHGI